MYVQYFRPREDIAELVSSYYSVRFDAPVADIMRAEIASVRFLVKGSLTTDLGAGPVEFAAKRSLLCGATHQASPVEFSRGFHVFGAAVTPLGWARMFRVAASDLADRVAPLEDHIGKDQAALAKRILNATDDETRVTICDHLFASMADFHKPINQHFIDEVTGWITTTESHDLADLQARLDLSARQVERLCKKYFGSSPQMLHRKFRALNSANQLSWHDLTNWRDVAESHYYDHPHFIREFKHFNGRTPKEFIDGPHLLVRTTLQERLQIEHESPLSLIG